MADERYPWLDQEAAERLLRGEPVDAVDDHAREQAGRLAHALESARPVPFARAAEAELPGEAAALAAFREAMAERAGSPSVLSASAADAPGSAGAVPAAELDGVRIAPVPSARRWGRSLRYGLAAAVAAVAVGGVAVAAGTGLLPRPFDETPAPPASSVTVADTPEPLRSHTPEDGSVTQTPPPVPPGTESPSAGSSPSPSSPGEPPATAGPGGGGTEGGRGGDATPPPKTGEGSGRDLTTLRARTLKACQDFKAGRLDDSDQRRLAGSARSGETVRRFCDRVLAGDWAGTGGAPGGSTGPAGGGSAGGKDDGRGDGSGDEDDRGDSAAGPVGAPGSGGWTGGGKGAPGSGDQGRGGHGNAGRDGSGTTGHGTGGIRSGHALTVPAGLAHPTAGPAFAGTPAYQV
ncbi:hypothetical protein [Streptomyces sp. NPDC008121]|uniref:hypothetical protein n=1 Tax=Streptomyces sp. NPDC008121 TaxID=3364809 RepID=UPI0036F008EB